MTIQEMHIAVNIGVQQIASHVNRGLEPEEIDFFLNNNIENFVREKYKEFESGLDVLDSLITLVKEQEVSPISSVYKRNLYIDTIELPEDFFFLVSQYATVFSKPPLGWTFGINDKRIGIDDADDAEIKWIQHDDLNKVLDSPFSSPSAELFIGTFVNNTFKIYTPENYAVNKCVFTYIKKPAKVSITSTPKVDCDLKDTVHQQIVDKTVLDILATWNKFGEQMNLQNLTTQP